MVANLSFVGLRLSTCLSRGTKGRRTFVLGTNSSFLLRWLPIVFWPRANWFRNRAMAQALKNLRVKPLLQVETFSWNLCATALRTSSQSGVTRWNSRFCHHCGRCNRCRSRNRFYFSWNLSRNGCSKSFTKPTLLHGATPAETCFATPLHTSFS